MDLSAHRARLLTRELVSGSDLILAMGPHHLERIEALGGSGKTHLLSAYALRGRSDRSITDPFGGDLDVYRSAFDELEPRGPPTYSSGSPRSAHRDDRDACAGSSRPRSDTRSHIRFLRALQNAALAARRLADRRMRRSMCPRPTLDAALPRLIAARAARQRHHPAQGSDARSVRPPRRDRTSALAP